MQLILSTYLRGNVLTELSSTDFDVIGVGWDPGIGCYFQSSPIDCNVQLGVKSTGLNELCQDTLVFLRLSLPGDSP